ncbi:MAG TPA: hypothetical protein VLS89_02200 [Candidatus Nanopelagicales bacterium]|nr:hypothetical protein [Candidatus Nanopelagicales bacterium]
MRIPSRPRSLRSSPRSSQRSSQRCSPLFSHRSSRLFPFIPGLLPALLALSCAGGRDAGTTPLPPELPAVPASEETGLPEDQLAPPTGAEGEVTRVERKEALGKGDWVIAIARGSKAMPHLLERAMPFGFTNPVFVR